MRTLPLLLLLGCLSLATYTETAPIRVKSTDSFKKIDNLVDKLRNEIKGDLRNANRQHQIVKRQHTSYVRNEKTYKNLKVKYDRLYRHYYHLLKLTTDKKTTTDKLRLELLAEVKLLDNVKHMIHSYANYAYRLKRHYANCNCSAT